MTTKKDDLETRLKQNEGQEVTIGVPRDGMQDPTGEYPKVEYNYGSSINKAARGTKINELYIGGGEVGVSLNIEPQRASEFPFNQVEETTSGHVVEYDDTPGGERILVKHRTGAGVEMRADGTVIISAVNNKVEVTGGDQTLIVEGHGNMVYNGNLNLVVKGDYNVDVAGNYNVNVAGNKKQRVIQNSKDVVLGNRIDEVAGTRSNRTIGRRTDMQFNDYTVATKGKYEQVAQGQINVHGDEGILMTGKKEFAVTAPNTNITGAKKVSVLGASGMIGGQKVDFTGKVYMGPAGPVPFASGATFYGNLAGQSLEAIASNTAFTALKAGTAGSLGAGGFGTPVSPKVKPTPPSGPVPAIPVVAGHAMLGTYSIKNVKISNDLANLIIYNDDYKGVFDTRPTTQEIRSSFRNSANKSKIAGQLVAEGRLSDTYNTKTPPKIGRTVGKAPKGRFGFTPLGNAIENRGKRFK